MEFLQDLAGSLFLATVLGLILAIAGSIAVGFIVKKSDLLKPMAMGLKLIVFFIAVQIFLHLGVAGHYTRLYRHVNFYSWLVFIFALFRVGLYIYGDLFIVRLKHGSFPAAFKNIITVFVVVVATLILLKEILNINVTSLIATTTVLTATIGLAFQSTLANMLAGLTIHLEKPLRQGDWISVAGHEGRVMDITLRSTRMKTIENNEVVIPNSKVLAEAVINYSLPDTATVRKLSVGVSFSIPPNKVKGAITTVLSGIEGVEKHPAPRVRVLHYGDFSINYEIRYAINDFSRYLETDAEIMDLLWYRFKRDGIEIPFPVRDVHLRQVTEQTRQVEQERREDGLLALMGKVDILSPLSTTELKILAKTVRVGFYAANEFPVRQGDAGDSFYIIKQGNVDVIVEKSSGGTAVVATLGPGDFFGEMSLLTGEARSASIRVKEDAEFIVIDKESFRSTLVNNPAIAESMSRILSERQAGLVAERERLGASAPGGRKDTSGRLLEKIREFFGLKR
jgi:small-conductance mechanosensitive channel/CRP-like cAMP-binding protein